jgi:hypothetical protein
MAIPGMFFIFRGQGMHEGNHLLRFEEELDEKEIGDRNVGGYRVRVCHQDVGGPERQRGDRNASCGIKFGGKDPSFGDGLYL